MTPVISSVFGGRGLQRIAVIGITLERHSGDEQAFAVGCCDPDFAAELVTFVRLAFADAHDLLPACSRIEAKVGPVMPDLRSFAPADRASSERL